MTSSPAKQSESTVTSSPIVKQQQQLSSSSVTLAAIDDDDMVYDPDEAVGQDHVIAVTGFFCKLCHKFYKNEDMARSVHCRSERHFDKYQVLPLAAAAANV